MTHKFKVGDRVIYTKGDSFYGNPELDGLEGTIIGVDRTAVPYTVEFDECLSDYAEDRRFGGKKGHCWNCTETHLTLVKKNEKGETQMEYNKSWSPEEDARLTQLKAEGKTAKEISAIIGRTLSSVNCRWSDLQRAMNNATPENQEGDLNDLEKIMAEQIKELTEKKEQLEAEIKGLCDDLEKACAENKELLEKICKLEDALAQRDAEATDAKAALAITEEQMDETRKAVQETEERLIKENHEQITHLKCLLAKRDARINDLEHELLNVYRTALRLSGRVMGYVEKMEIPQI